MKNIIISIISLFFLFPLHAQDLHFSQWGLNSSMRNPATMGQGICDNRLAASYRTQWSSIPDAYRNITLAFDQKVNKFSWGASLLHNDAGKASLRTSQVLMGFSYRKKLSARDEFLSIGGSGGLIQQRFQPELFQFDNQYVEGTGFDQSLSNGETIVKTNQMLPTFSVGVFATKYFNRIKGSAGLSFSHLNEPTAQFFETSTETYPMRTSVFANAQIPVRTGLKAEIHGAFNSQSVASEKMAGAKILYQLNQKNWLNVGIASRMGDAVILQAGMTFKHSTFNVSYDMNNSKLSPVTNTRGAIELSMTYCFNKRAIEKEQPIAQPFPVEPRRVGIPQEKDSDGDGIVDNLDECPTVPGLRHFNGCNDTDRDGVWDSKDACPHLYGEKSNQGCPTNALDTDKDGLIDEVDKCPFIKGTADMGGCPDSDKDGLSDLEDYCPFLKGEKSNNGCPSMNQEEHKEFITQKSVSAIVEFDTDKSFIKNYY
jgi:type IX secretion system PorP/SprF family membrane protein